MQSRGPHGPKLKVFCGPSSDCSEAASPAVLLTPDPHCWDMHWGGGLHLPLLPQLRMIPLIAAGWIKLSCLHQFVDVPHLNYCFLDSDFWLLETKSALWVHSCLRWFAEGYCCRKRKGELLAASEWCHGRVGAFERGLHYARKISWIQISSFSTIAEWTS